MICITTFIMTCIMTYALMNSKITYIKTCIMTCIFTMLWLSHVQVISLHNDMHNGLHNDVHIDLKNCLHNNLNNYWHNDLHKNLWTNEHGGGEVGLLWWTRFAGSFCGSLLVHMTRSPTQININGCDIIVNEPSFTSCCWLHCVAST